MLVKRNLFDTPGLVIQRFQLVPYFDVWLYTMHNEIIQVQVCWDIQHRRRSRGAYDIPLSLASSFILRFKCHTAFCRS